MNVMLVIRSPKNEAVLLKNHPVCVNPDQDFFCTRSSINDVKALGGRGSCTVQHKVQDDEETKCQLLN